MSADGGGSGGNDFYHGDLSQHKPSNAPVEYEIPPEEGAERPGGAIGEVLRRSSHPTITLVHVSFKLAPVASYLLLGILLRSFVVQFVVTVTLLAFDFWVVKNVSGRFLVGLRWWTDVLEDGTTTWRFESAEGNASINATDSRVFWWTMYLTPLVWVGLGVLAVLRFEFKWLLVVATALVLNVTNLVGYFKCSSQQQAEMRQYVHSSVVDGAMRYFTGE